MKWYTRTMEQTKGNVTMENPFLSKAQNWEASMKILSEFEGCVEATHEYFEHWIEDENEGDWHEWLACGHIVAAQFDAWPVPVPYIETQFGNFVYDPAYQKWLDDDGLEERLSDSEE